MRRVLFVLLLHVFGLSALAQKNAVIVCVIAALAPMHEPGSLQYRFQPREIRLAENAFGNNSLTKFAKKFHPPRSPHNEGVVPASFTNASFENSLRLFAADKTDLRSVTYQALPEMGGTKVKMHLVTGELLITNAKGEVGAYVKLPTDRPIGKFESTGALFEELTGTLVVPQKLGVPVRRFAKLTAGESLDVIGFTSASHLEAHADKHVLGLTSTGSNGSLLTPAQKYARVKDKGPNPTSEFQSLQIDFLGEMKSANGDSAKEQKAYEKMRGRYAKASEDFANSTKATILTYTKAEVYNGQPQFLSYRFDTLTNEFAIVNRLSGKVITYYKVDIDVANGFLQTHQVAKVNTPLEYFLAMVKVDYH